MKLVGALSCLSATLALAPALAANLPAGAASVASVNGVVISDPALNDALERSGAPESAPLRTALKSQLIARELLRQEAHRRGLAKDRDVLAAAQAAQDNAMIEKYLKQSIKPQHVGEDQVRKRYDAIVASLGEQEYRPRIIQTRDEASAKQVLAELRAGKTFDELAHSHSLASSARNGGVLDWVSFKLPLRDGATQGVPLPLAEVLTRLKPGMLAAEPIAWKDAWFVVRLDEARPTRVPDYEQIKPTLRQMLERQELERATAALVAELIRNAKIKQ
jgi:parvulin-like peptidyl-prolyl isomerase